MENRYIMRVLAVMAAVALVVSLTTQARIPKQTEREMELITEELSTEELSTEFDDNYEDNLYVLSHVINGEACGCSWEMKIGVGSVVINRVHSDVYPDTIRDVVFQSGQYACTWDGNYDRKPEEESVEAAEYLLKHGSQYPDEVVYQANFTQGSGVYEVIGNMYFCY